MPEPTYVVRIDTDPQRLASGPHDDRRDARADARRLEADHPGEYVAVAETVVRAATDVDPADADREVSA